MKEQIEMSLIGALVNNYDSIRPMVEEAELNAEMLSCSKCASVFKAADKLAEEFAMVSMLSLKGELSRGSNLPQAEAEHLWFQFMDECANDEAMPWHVPGHCEMIRKEHAGQLLTLASVRAGDMIKAGNLDRAINELSINLDRATGSLAMSRDAETSEQVAARAVDIWDQARAGKPLGIKSSWNGINEYIGSWVYGDCNVIGAYRDTGKTFAMCNEVVHSTVAATDPVPTCIVSLDMRTDQVVQRMISQIGEFSTFRMDTNDRVDDQMIDAMHHGKEAIAKAPISFYSGPGDIKRIINSLKVHVRKYGVRSVWIDYFQRLSGSSKHSNRNSELEYVVRALCDFFAEYKVAGMVLSQFNRSSEQQEREPRLSDLKDCGSLEQDSRKVILISPADAKDWGDNHYLWHVAKNNTGAKGKVIMKRVANRSRWDFVQHI